MKNALTLCAAACAAVCAAGEGPVGWDGSAPSELKVSADRMAADNVTGDLVATGHVRAVSAPVCLLSELVERRGDEYRFADPTLVTTCTNAACSLHWSATGGVTYRDGHGITAKNVVVRLFGVPVAWLPWWYYPLDTDYGWRVMPGYTGRWGAYLLSKYVYRIAGDYAPGAFGLSGSTRLDLRSENGVALGQGLRWQLGDFGRGRFNAYWAWDEDADRYDRRWTSSRKWHYENWSNKVHDERYGFMFEHRWEASERDSVRAEAAYYSDRYFRTDFLREGRRYGATTRFADGTANELAWEHNGDACGFGASVSGPLNSFYTGTSRLPEFYFDAMPQRVFATPFNYESESRIGWLKRDYAKHGSPSTFDAYRFGPGEWARYEAFRFDTYHRVTLPFRVGDVVSVVPRVGVRGTFWSSAGTENLTGYGRAHATHDGQWRMIVEGGVTFAARGRAELGDGWTHVAEPYLDVLAQEAHLIGARRGERPYVFDSLDASSDWLDQFAGRSRNLPYTWYGVTPGWRNAFRQTDERGVSRTVADIDLYAAVQFNDVDYTEGGANHRLTRRASDPNYGERGVRAMPGLRARWMPGEGTALASRAEYDTQSGCLAYADVSFRQKLSKEFKYAVSYIGRNQRRWDFSSTPYASGQTEDESFNHIRYSFLELELEQEVCDAFAWGPYVRWDFREDEVDEAGAWFDLRTDCLGFRFTVGYENDYRRVDGSRSGEDWRFGFFIYLRALGPSSGSPF